MLLITWSLSLFVAKSAKKLILFVITSAWCWGHLPPQGKALSFCYSDNYFVPCFIIPLEWYPVIYKLSCSPLQPGIRLEDADK